MSAKKGEKANKKEVLLTELEKLGFRKTKNLGQKASDKLTKWAGSWTFILLFLAFIIVWMFVNTYYWIRFKQGDPFDPFPFILLNLALSCVAAIQAPIILMSQNRQAQRDRAKAEYDYHINKKAEKEIREIKSMLIRHHKIQEGKKLKK
ncbi:MAG: DUF1003 domain-containing protein [archaeon]